MADGFTLTDNLPPYVLDGLFDSFSDESLSDVDDRNNNDVGELATEPEAKRILTAGVFSMATQTSVMMNVTVKTLRMSCALNYQCWMIRSFIFVRRKRCM